MNISRIEVFVEVVKNGGFASAARKLGISAPAVSKQVQLLERELGVMLLNRTTRSMNLTEEGSIYYQGARTALDDLYETEQAVLELRSAPAGRIKVNAPRAFGDMFLTQPLADFARQYPQVELEVNFSDGWVDIIGEGYDLVVRIGALDDSTLIARQLAPCPIVLCASPELLRSNEMLKHPDQVASFPAVTYSQHQSEETWVYTRGRETGRVKLRKKLSSNTAEMQLAACLNGVGLALLPIFAAHRYLQSGELVHCLPEYKTIPERGVHFLYPSSRQTSTRTRLLIEHLLEAAQKFAWYQ